MSDFDYYNNFKYIVLYKWLGLLVALSSVLPIALFRDFLGDSLAGFITFVLIGLSAVLLWMYRCPVCKAALNPRISVRKTLYCHECGSRLRK